MASVAVFGAGIAGLTVAHELALRGHNVRVFESTAEPGGFFRSDRLQPGGVPTEYSWHGFGPWYHNCFDLLKDIPLDKGTVYEALSRPIDFGLAPDRGTVEFDHGGLFVPVAKMFRMRGLDRFLWSWLMLKSWSANVRSQQHYAGINAAQAWKPLLSRTAWRTWRSCFGPWIGSDWTNVSLHQAGEFFRKQLQTRPSHHHTADEEGPAWEHGARDGWLVLRGPSNEVWFEPWVRFQKQKGVSFCWSKPLHHFAFRGKNIEVAVLEGGEQIAADYFVLAINPFSAVGVIERTPNLESVDQLNLFRPLTQRGPHFQVSFRIAFRDRIKWPKRRMAFVLADSEFNITLFPQEQAWRPEVNLGRGVESLWTATACVATVPGRIHGLPLAQCSKDQFLEEVKMQILDCQSLNEIIKKANGGRELASFPISKIEVWHEWRFSKCGLRGSQPKWVNTTKTQFFQPCQRTPIRNLLLAGAHTRTAADVWSIEAAVESGRLAAQAIDPSVPVCPQFKPLWVRVLRKLDDLSYRLHLPHILDFALVIAAAITLGVFGAWLLRWYA